MDVINVRDGVRDKGDWLLVVMVQQHYLREGMITEDDFDLLDNRRSIEEDWPLRRKKIFKVVYERRLASIFLLVSTR